MSTAIELVRQALNRFRVSAVGGFVLYCGGIRYSLRVAMEHLRRHILTRLRRGPADESALARWCDTRPRLIRPTLELMRIERRIVCFSGRYALPFTRRYPRPLVNVAGPITIGRRMMQRWA